MTVLKYLAAAVFVAVAVRAFWVWQRDLERTEEARHVDGETLNRLRKSGL